MQLAMLLDQHLSRPRTPASLRRTLEDRWLEAGERRRASPRLARFARTVATLSAGAALVVAAQVAWRARAKDSPMVAEAVNDHLRILYSDHPVEVESGGIHRVKPWVAGASISRR